MEAFLEKARKINEEWNDLPRRGLIVLVTCILLLVAGSAFKYFAPFVCALVFSAVIRPLARPFNYLFRKVRVARSVGILLAVIIVFGLIVAGLAVLTAALIGEARDLLESLPRIVNDATAYITKLAEQGQTRLTDSVGEQALEMVTDMLKSALQKLAGMASTFAGELVSFTWSAVTVLPEVILFVIFTIMESYYIVADADRIGGFTHKWLPERVTSGLEKVKKVMVMGVRAQIVTALVQMLIAAAVLLIGYSILGVDYAVMFAILISVLDALPVIGAGLIMLPQTAYYLIIGDYMLGAGVMALYCIVLIIKRVMEPKILGKQMRLNQLLTMIAMYAGFRVMGFIGLLAGPLMLILFRVVLSDSSATPATPAPAIEHKKLRRRKR